MGALESLEFLFGLLGVLGVLAGFLGSLSVLLLTCSPHFDFRSGLLRFYPTQTREEEKGPTVL